MARALLREADVVALDEGYAALMADSGDFARWVSYAAPNTDSLS